MSAGQPLSLARALERPAPILQSAREPLDFVCWKWAPMAGYRSSFGPHTVNTLKRMLARHYPSPHRLTCITDQPEGIDADVRILPLWKDLAHLPSPHGGRNPSCYRRLKAFSAEAAELIGPRFVSLDLDCVIVGDLSPLVDRPDDFVIWGDTNPTTYYNGSFWLLRAGARRQVWESFDERRSPRLATQMRQFGSDQAWIGACLGPREAKWGTTDGVYSYRVHIQPRGGRLPDGARIVFFHGQHDPWDPEPQALAWVRDHYR